MKNDRPQERRRERRRRPDLGKGIEILTLLVRVAEVTARFLAIFRDQW